jgi:hypothetical protein
LLKEKKRKNKTDRKADRTKQHHKNSSIPFPSFIQVKATVSLAKSATTSID